jgi:sarcosine oxidase
MGDFSCFDVVVIGGGVNGLATAYHLSRQTSLKVALVEQFSLGHKRGSSHGFSRIFRSTYTNPVYTNLARLAQMQEWPSLEQGLGCRLLYPNSRCVFGLGARFEANVKAALESDLDVELLEAPAARQLFPQFRFSESLHVLRDHSSSLIAANVTMENLAKIVRQRKVSILEETKVLSINPSPSSIQLETTQGRLSCERLVITAGPWIGECLPELNHAFSPIRQVIGYFKLRGMNDSYQVGPFPNWVYFGERENEIFYGLPEFGCEGIKVAQDVAFGKGDDPDEKNFQVDPDKARALVDFVSDHFVQPVDRLVRLESCFYTNTPTSGFLLSLLPHDHRIAIGAACSGHAFKFAPLTGRILSELVLNGKTTIPEFEEQRELFSAIIARI